MPERLSNKKGLLFFLFNFCSLLSLASLDSSITFAKDTETSQISEVNSHTTENISFIDTAMAEGLETEAIWFGYTKEVTIATRHETPINKAPSIVTAITGKEIKNLGYRTFIEILRTIPGFEIRKEPGTGVVEPIVRGIEGANKVKVMLNGHTR